MTADRDALIAQVRTYVQHKLECRWHLTDPTRMIHKPCTCGLDTLLSKADSFVAQVRTLQEKWRGFADQLFFHDDVRSALLECAADLDTLLSLIDAKGGDAHEPGNAETNSAHCGPLKDTGGVTHPPDNTSISLDGPRRQEPSK